ncbi:lytic transglycosylase domain-containing protein [Helicobacter cetorum]|uniref:Soluble lytic murein transglycosylase n=1 Tax=Helicobacter cetorum (strain ATCC BAA-540 / CCUG 52418 / MIT 99-5656) TaxID=1163745 RepID=I0ETT4_HELCM|nr:lytic transglycosylase domain-containing protein [Helicobacter cetorum]AFI06353.1 soluble lytic murein transglycosylase [Helicobacter cetorum MIT 99-5656]
MRFLVLFFIGMLGISFSKTELSLKDLEKKPAGIARDYYLWRYISDKKTSLENAKKAYELTQNKNSALQKAMHEKGLENLEKNPNVKMPEDIHCKQITLENALEEINTLQASCIAIALKSKIKDFDKISLKTLKPLQEKIKESYPILYEELTLLQSRNISVSMFKANAQVFSALFNHLSYEKKLQIFEEPISIKELNRLLDENYPAFNRLIYQVILDPKLNHFKDALAKSNATHSNAQTFFILGINEILRKKPSKALKYFERSEAATKDDVFLRDRAIFWQYLVSKKKKTLERLSKSDALNLYSIYASHKLEIAPNYRIISSIQNLSKKNPPFNTSDPFLWQNFKEKALSLQDEAAFNNTLKSLHYEKSAPELTYLLRERNKDRLYYYLSPYEGIIAWQNNDEKAMAYAIARQESFLLPALISRSFALGLMQIMPFNVEPFAKNLGLENIDLNDMFNPNIALKFGNYYLNHLKKEFNHPLFVAYAYNAGPGFLRRWLESSKRFKEKNRFEPWLSMELVPYSETRLYGFKVMANYLIYQEIFGNFIPVDAFLQQTLNLKDKK